MNLPGGCQCGVVRYAVEVLDGDPADYCHCAQCRKATGAPVAAWVQVPPARFRVVQGRATEFVSSPIASRWFCGTCGSPLYMTDPGRRSVGVLLATLDTPEALAPTQHGWVSARIPWFDTADDLPRHAESPPYDL
ncbi:MAG TPA: GFA family protein [Stellaceae bacterium]|nr:GFA family protein [Stellaceae bacterium]